MIKLLLALAIIFTLTACGSTPVKVKTETVEVLRPVLYCPPPNYDEIATPGTLPIDFITSDTSDGEVAIRYSATIKVLEEYIKRLELSLEQYDDTSKALKDLQEQLDNR